MNIQLKFAHHHMRRHFEKKVQEFAWKYGDDVVLDGIHQFWYKRTYIARRKKEIEAVRGKPAIS